MLLWGLDPQAQTIIATNLTGIALLVAKAIFDRKEQKKSTTDRAEIKQAAATAVSVAKQTKDDVSIQLDLARRRVEDHLIDVSTKLDANTVITKEAGDTATSAYNEANGVNQKLASIGNSINGMMIARLDRIDAELERHAKNIHTIANVITPLVGQMEIIGRNQRELMNKTTPQTIIVSQTTDGKKDDKDNKDKAV